MNDSLTKNKKKLITPYDPEYFLKGFILLVKNNEEPFEIFDRSCTFSGARRPDIKYNTSNPQNM